MFSRNTKLGFTHVDIVGLMGTCISSISDQFENGTCWMLGACSRKPSINNQQYDYIRSSLRGDNVYHTVQDIQCISQGEKTWTSNRHNSDSHIVMIRTRRPVMA